MWHENTTKPEPGRKIEYVMKVRYEICVGVWTGDVIKTADEDLDWGIVLYWRYV